MDIFGAFKEYESIWVLLDESERIIYPCLFVILNETLGFKEEQRMRQTLSSANLIVLKPPSNIKTKLSLLNVYKPGSSIIYVSNCLKIPRFYNESLVNSNYFENCEKPKEKLRGEIIETSAFGVFPYIFNRNGNIQGIDIQILNIVKESLQFSTNMKWAKNWGIEKEDGNWTGTIGDVHKGIL